MSKSATKYRINLPEEKLKILYILKEMGYREDISERLLFYINVEDIN